MKVYKQKWFWLSSALLAALLTAWWLYASRDSPKISSDLQLRVAAVPVATGLNVPWQMQWLPTGRILFTELGGDVKQLHVSSGKVTTLYQVSDLAREVQAGLLGLAIDPDFPDNKLCYVAFNYYLNDEIFLRVDALRIGNETAELSHTVVDRIPSFAISIGGRLLIDSNRKLFITVGEGSDSEAAQNITSLRGKILRYNLDGSIPPDNPDPQSPVWCKGFRNPQGLAATPAGIYATEHGTFSNDELNLIGQGGNYGWPLVSGMCPEDSSCNDGYQYAIESWTPTVAPSGLCYYRDSHYPFLSNSLLIACLKGQRIRCVKLNGEGDPTTTIDLAVHSIGRIRDVLATPDGRIYAASSNEDVYGISRGEGDGIFELIPEDSLIVIPKQVLTPPSMIPLDSSNLVVDVVAENLRLPWDLNWVNPDQIWFNERGGAIKQLDLTSGNIRTIHQVEDVFQSSDNSGMHGFAVHPDYPEKPFIYGHYTFELYKSRLVRYEVDPAQFRVIRSKILIDNIEANKSHNGSRIVFGPDKKIYFNLGDAYKRRAAQKLDRLNGKTLRINDDGSIPVDNPFHGSYIYSMGHRNPQGLAWSHDKLYASEHGSNDDDEINLIEPGGNYGFPQVQGMCDERSERRFCDRNQIVEPLIAWTPTIAPSGIDYYGHSSIPEWRNSLLVTTLKSGPGSEGQRLLQAKLDNRGESILEVNEFLTFSFGRLRDVLVAPDGRVFICTSNQESNQNANEIVQVVDDRIIELRVSKPSPPNL